MFLSTNEWIFATICRCHIYVYVCIMYVCVCMYVPNWMRKLKINHSGVLHNVISMSIIEMQWFGRITNEKLTAQGTIGHTTKSESDRHHDSTRHGTVVGVRTRFPLNQKKKKNKTEQKKKCHSRFRFNCLPFLSFNASSIVPRIKWLWCFGFISSLSGYVTRVTHMKHQNIYQYCSIEWNRIFTWLYHSASVRVCGILLLKTRLHVCGSDFRHQMTKKRDECVIWPSERKMCRRIRQLIMQMPI